MNVLITGCAGFIGSRVARMLLERGDKVIGVDNLNDYYDVSLKQARLDILKKFEGFVFMRGDVADYDFLEEVAKSNKIDKILHLAAQAGVRYSLINPMSYEDANNKGTLNMLEIARHFNVKDFVFASSSSVYGGIKEYPFHEDMDVSKPVSLYAASKRNGELICYTYHHLFNIRCRCLRFFTVYGPYGRPDMALFLFTSKILKGEPIDVYNKGDMIRDFTFVDDIARGVVSALDNDYEYEIFNLACGNPEKLTKYIEVLEENLNIKAKKNMMPIQQGDVQRTEASIEKAQKMLNYNPKTRIEQGIKEFVQWYKEYYEV